ncbi:OsmC family protein [Pelomonas sp. Root1444]|uniref:OsmC family protein n=1 Tax=Pelomonas sp. Root1444 TaxID=1736464 RepID=UPI000703B66C|nr:OsmC family protein [Pelomonas sp. Root1444]KQY90595.1 osmotically inducible protein OsmC [Pelomonas sp. Root1444]
MALDHIAAALERVAAVMRKRPELGLHDDSPARVRWEGGMRVSARHDNGLRVETDMPRELGGSGEGVTPGWLLRAGTASCAVTCIVMNAATQGVELQALDAWVSSRSDTRGLLGLAGDNGQAVDAAPVEMTLHIRIAAAGLTQAQTRGLVEQSCLRSPVPAALRQPVPLQLDIEVTGSAA